MPAQDQSVVKMIEVSKVYRDFWGRQRVKALEGLNLEVKPGEVFGLLGPNGSGKTTAVRLMLGLLFPTRGVVRMFDKSPRDVSIKKRIGYMPEESHFYDYLNAEETLDFFGRLFRLDRSVRRRRADALIEMVGLKRARRRPVREYSKGMARRIGLAQALINDPDLLILDEPTTGLDPIGAHEIKDLVATLKKRGKTIFLCSHLLADVEQVCDRILILYGGKGRAVGEVSELLTEDEITEIRTPRLPDSLLQRVTELIRAERGDQTRVDVGSPSRRLEEFFLDVVEEARRERLATAGAEAGAATAEFLLGEKEKEGKELVQELVSASGAPEPEEGVTAPEPAQAVPMHDRGVIARLVKSVADDSMEEARKEPEPLAPEGEVQRGLIEELEAAGSEAEKGAEEEPPEEKSDSDTDSD